jgi:hypothetical protein
MNEIVRGKRAPLRKVDVDAIAIKALRSHDDGRPHFARLGWVEVYVAHGRGFAAQLRLIMVMSFTFFVEHVQ